MTDGATTPTVPDQLRLLATSQVPSLQGGHDFTVTVRAGTIGVTMDGTSVLTATVTLPSSVYFGFSAGTGGNPPAVQSVSNITVDATLGTGIPVLTPTPILPGAAPSFVDRTAFLYTGTGKVQTGVAAGTIKASRAAVLRGHVVGDDKTSPATGTVITVLGHPEYGQTIARADGWFDMAVNGGGSLTIDYQRAGHLPYLTSITDRDGLLTQIARSGSTITITAPFGQQTKLGSDANGYLATVTAPNTAEVTKTTHAATGLLTDFWDAKSNHHTFAYDTDGRLTKDTDAVTSSLGIRLAATTNATQTTVTVTSPEGRAVAHNSDRSSTATDRTRLEQRVITASGKATTTMVEAADGLWSSSTAAGSTFLSSSQVNASANDPRWGSLAPFVSASTESNGARTLTRTETRTATLASGLDPYSVSAMTIASAVAASGLPTRTWTRAYQYATPATWLATSPEGRQTRTTLEDKERVTKLEVLGSDPVTLAAVQYHYDTSGRVDQVTNGTRIFGTTYDAAGWVSGTTAPESLNTSITSRDANGRALTVVLPGSRTVGTTYDLAGNMASVTPSGKTAHAFTSNETNRLGCTHRRPSRRPRGTRATSTTRTAS